MPRYSIDIIGRKMRHLGTVVADNERKALEQAIKQIRGKASSAEQDRGDEDRGQ
jgi:hypothetical protein